MSGSPAWFVSFHGGAPVRHGSPHGDNNLRAYDAKGREVLDTVLPSGSGAPPLHELRGMALDASGRLYVANATEADSRVLRYQSPTAPRRPWRPDGSFPDATGKQALDHPYGLVLTPAGDVLVSTQGSGTADPNPNAGVLRVPADGGAPITLVSSAVDLPAAQGGLCGPRSMVLVPPGVSASTAVLLVADNLGNAVRSYDAATGRWLGDLLPHKGSPPLREPVGLALLGDRLFVSSETTNTVLSVHLTTGKVHRAVPEKLDGVTLHHPAGIAVGADGRLYVSNRLRKQVVAYTLSRKRTHATGASLFLRHLPDEPEQLLPVAAGASATTPAAAAPGSDPRS